MDNFSAEISSLPPFSYGVKLKSSFSYLKPFYQAPCPLNPFPTSCLASQNQNSICSASTYLHMIGLLPGFVFFHMSAWQTLLFTLSSSVSLHADHVGPFHQSSLHQSFNHLFLYSALTLSLGLPQSSVYHLYLCTHRFQQIWWPSEQLFRFPLIESLLHAIHFVKQFAYTHISFSLLIWRN